MLPWPLLQGRWIDGAPTLRIPSCAGECPSPLTSANTSLTEPRETGVHYLMTQPQRCEPNTRSTRPTDHLTRPAASYKQHDRPLDTASRFIQGNMNALRRRWPPVRGPRHRDITSQTRTRNAAGADATAAR